MKKVFDKTHLSIDHAEDRLLIHRDYLAHCHRWSFFCNLIKITYKPFGPGGLYNNAKILDFGCGKRFTVV